ncbi:unnamed protein product [Rhizophagus irregularis]|uniref:Copper-fist-domain-containing protein n=1 Tax=Rhizophagus irregularis TaxID=588596 RepID=A0A2N1NLK3_9GLOM|nr:copper-fist-domain-containing protein [Rhizophagus irregularis]CAB4401435.1 unnamed protein product [Rhizophagus irregularis]CAB5361742.1 unnamed protein product [Rhizophagus irregularis]
MVFIDGVKYACATCIKGHRSTACQHSDRALFVIKRKGRPITQCSHCRELRKTQKIHVKCNCNEKKKEESSLSQPQAVAVLPQGISADDEYRPASRSKTSVEALLNPCQCLTGAKCICCRLDSSDMLYSNPTTDTSVNNNDSSHLPTSAQTAIYTLPPISANLNQHQYIHGYDNSAKGKSVNPQLRFTTSLNNNGGGYSKHINSSVEKGSSPFASTAPLESGYSYNDKDDTDFKSYDQSGILGKEICRSTSTDLANKIYSSFQSCSTNMTDRSCCGGNNSPTMMPICRCGPGCKCSGCDTHAKRVNVEYSYNNLSSNSLSSSCCSSHHEITQPEHKKIRDEDGVLLCGCGCQKLDTECADCLENLCEEYLLK